MTAVRAGAAACALTLALIAHPAPGASASPSPAIVRPSESGTPWSAGEIAALRARIDRLLASAPGLRGAHTGLFAVDAASGAVIYAHGADEEFIPASNAKLVTGSAALVRLGAAFRFRTDAVTSGRIVEGTLQGPLVIRGTGDVQLNTADLDDLAATLRRAGIVRLQSAPVVDASYFDARPFPDGWLLDDVPYDYAAVVSATSFHENAVRLTVTPGDAAGAAATVVATPYGHVDAAGTGCSPTNDVHVLAAVRTGARGTDASVDLRRNSWGCIEVTGVIPLGGKPYPLDAAVPSPGAYLRAALIERLAVAGIQSAPATESGPIVGGDAFGALPAGATVTTLWTHRSEALTQLLADFWLPSDNLIGEALLKALSARAGVAGTSAAGVTLEASFLRSAGIDPATVDLYDGSGLSRYDRMTPRALVAVLAYDWRAPFRATVLDALPVAGVRGTLKNAYLGTPVARRLFAKTGGMLDVTNLSGYLQTTHHGALTFSFLIGDALGDDAAIAHTRTAILSALLGS